MIFAQRDENHKESIYVHGDNLDAPADGSIGDNQQNVLKEVGTAFNDLGSEKSYGLVLQNCDHKDTSNMVRDDLEGDIG